MSGDVQPRKRKDKRRKRDEDESSHGVDITKMGGDDVLLHVHENHGTGGHWCAKVFFFALLTVLLGLIALIVLESRGVSDLDTPLSESRFSNYFDGWVDESPAAHDEHDAIQASIEEHDDHDEPFEEEEDLSEGDEHVDHDDEEDDEENGHTHEEDEENEEDDNEEEEVNEDTKEAHTAEQTQEDDEDNDDDVEEDKDQDNDDEDEDEGEDTTKERRQTVEDENDDDEEDEKTAEENDNEDNDDDVDENTEHDDDDNENDNAEDDDDDAAEEPIEPIYTRSSQQHAKPSSVVDEDDDDDDPFDEEDDDGTFESVEPVVVDNDAEELLLLQEKARQQAAEAAKNEPPQADDDEDEVVAAASSWASSLAVKIGVGVALALVARLVLIRKNPNTMDEPPPEIMMKRRLTIATAEDTYPEEEEPPLLDDELSGEEAEIEEEEIEYIEEEEEIEIEVDDNGDEISSLAGYIPETFEQLNAMYRSVTESAAGLQTRNGKDEKPPQKPIDRVYQPSSTLSATSKKASPVFVAPPPPPVQTKAPPQTQAPPSTSASTSASASNISFNTNPSSSTPSTTLIPASRPPLDSTAVSVPSNLPPDSSGTTSEVAHDLDYQPDEDDIDYDDDEIYEEEEEDEDEELDLHLVDDEADISDVDDSELMNRLEAKYGRLPTKEYESDEDPDDPSWTQIKPKQTPGAGPQAVDTDDEADAFDKELRRANEEMMRENYPAALQAFSLLSEKYADKPQVFLGYAKTLDKLSEQQKSNKMLGQALEAYKRYLAFDELIEDDEEYRTAAERCIERMRFIGYHSQAVALHEQLIARFPNVPQLRNDLAVTYLLVNRLAEAKLVLQQTLQRWPMNGFAQVHYGFVLKQLDKDYKNAVIYLQQGIRSKAEGTQDGRFYFNLGDALQRLGRPEEALKIYERGAALKLFPSVYQRSLYNVPHLKAQPFWTKNETTYGAFFERLEQNWLAVRAEGLSVLSKSGYFVDEAENLRDTGDWKQFELIGRGQRSDRNCQKAPITCGLIERFTPVSSCRRGQVKFSVMHPNTHVWPHCGPTNCRLRAHLGLVVPQGTVLRVAKEERTWTEGKFLIFDDSFEHEVWHNGTDLRLILIVDVWHPQLSEWQRRNLSPI